MTIGITMEERAPHRLKIPPARPSKLLGAKIVTNTQVIVASPFPKKATDIKVMIRYGFDV